MKKVPLKKFIFNSDNQNEKYVIIANVFSNIVEKHVALKRKFSRGNQAPFMTKEFCKAIFRFIKKLILELD